MKAPGARTQRRVGEFTTQTAEQYYGIMAVDKVTRLVDVRLPKEILHNENMMYSENSTREYNVSGRYYVTILPDGSHKLKSDSKQLTTSGIDDNLLAVYRRLVMNNEEWDGEAPCTLTGYTHAIVNGDDGESIKYNAHPCYHGAAWYDWAYVQYDIDGEQMFYPSRVLGFTKLGDGSINAIIQYSMEDVTWDRLQKDFVVPFRLCTEASKENIVPLTSLCHPICVVPNFGAENLDDYLLILPKGEWSQYFTRFIHKTN